MIESIASRISCVNDYTDKFRDDCLKYYSLIENSRYVSICEANFKVLQTRIKSLKTSSRYNFNQLCCNRVGRLYFLTKIPTIKCVLEGSMIDNMTSYTLKIISNNLVSLLSSLLRTVIKNVDTKWDRSSSATPKKLKDMGMIGDNQMFALVKDLLVTNEFRDVIFLNGGAMLSNIRGFLFADIHQHVFQTILQINSLVVDTPIMINGKHRSAKQIALTVECLSQLLIFTIKNDDLILRCNFLDLEMLDNIAWIVGKYNCSDKNLNNLYSECSEKSAMNLMSIHKMKTVISHKTRTHAISSTDMTYSILSSSKKATDWEDSEDIWPTTESKTPSINSDIQDELTHTYEMQQDDNTVIRIEGENGIAIYSEENSHEIPMKLFKMMEYIRHNESNVEIRYL